MIKSRNIIDNPMFRVSIMLVSLLVVATLSIVFLERTSVDLKNYGEALWWTIVTITTVGYGDYTPDTLGGRILAVFLMFSGIGLMAVVTGTISSVFTTKKIMEGRGLDMIKDKKHLIICGWNNNVEKVLQCLAQIGHTMKQDVVLINDLQENQLNTILAKYNNLKLKYLIGDYTNESTLTKANITEADSIILLSSDSHGNDDEKIILTTLTVKNLVPSIKVVASVAERDKIPYLKKANADEIITNENFKSFLAATHIIEPGVPQAVNQLLDVHSPHRFKSEKIPENLVGKTFKDLFEYYKEENSICIGTYIENESLGISEFLSSEEDVLDRFIEKKIRESGHTLSEQSQVEVFINPENEHILSKGEGALLIL